MLTQIEKQEFFEQGYIVLPGRLTGDFVDPALAALSEWHLAFSRLSQLEQKKSWVRDQAMDRYKDSFWEASYKVVHLLAESVLGVGNLHFCGPQLVGTGGRQLLREESTTWHIDPVEVVKRDKRYHLFPELDLVIGCYLTEMKDPNCGNLIVWPKSHWAIQDYFRSESSRDELILDMYNVLTPIMGEGTPILGGPGDVVLMNAFLAHATGQNAADAFSGRAYFRYRTLRSSRTETSVYQNVWWGYEGMPRELGNTGAII